MTISQTLSVSVTRSILCLFMIGLGACASAPERGQEKVPPAEPVNSGEPVIDVLGLQRSLGLEAQDDELGYKEKAFNTCRVGYGFSSSRDCRTLFLSVINFRLQCRDSEGTVSNALGAADLEALKGREIGWVLKGSSGVVRTDGQGYAELRLILPESPRHQRLRLGAGTQFLYIRAGELTRVVTPRPWCDQ